MVRSISMRASFHFHFVSACFRILYFQKVSVVSVFLQIPSQYRLPSGGDEEKKRHKKKHKRKAEEEFGTGRVFLWIFFP